MNEKVSPVVSWTKRVGDLIKRRQQSRHRTRSNVPRETRILTQCEFYFGDANLRRDQYMHRLFAADPYGWITYDQLCQFPLLRRMDVSPGELAHVLRRTDFFLSDRATGRIRRNFDMYPNKEVEDQLKNLSSGDPSGMNPVDRRSVYIEDLPLDMDQEDVNMELTTQFPRLEVKYVSMPRHMVTGESFGCAIVELGSEEEAAHVVKKFKKVETDKFDAKNGMLGRTVRVVSMKKYRVLKRMYMKAKCLSVKNRLNYANEHHIDQTCSNTTISGEDHNSDDSSVLLDSDINSLAQDSVEVRRSRNASSIRSNSLIHISELPASLSSSHIRVWLSHSCAVQFLDHKEGSSSAIARFSSRSERDFFLKDFSRTQLPVHGVVVPHIRAMTEEECLDYFEAERERRRAQCLTMGPPDMWDITKAKRPLSEGTRTTKLHVIQDPPPGTKKFEPISCAFTDTVAGNRNKAENGTSMLFGIHKGRHVARKFFMDALREQEPVEKEEQPTKRQRIDNNPVRKKTRRGKRGGQYRRIIAADIC